MKRARSPSPEHAEHPLVQILTLVNYSTIRRQLYDALDLDNDGATAWSLSRVTRNVRLHKPFFRTLHEWAEFSITTYNASASPALQEEILAYCRRRYTNPRFHGFVENMRRALEYDAPLRFLHFLWNDHLTVQERTIFTNKMLKYQRFTLFGRHKTGFNIVAFLWETIFEPHMSDVRVKPRLLSRYMNYLVNANVAYDAIHWFQSKLHSHIDATWTDAKIYVRALQSHSYSLAKECFARMSNEHQNAVTHHHPHIYDMVFSLNRYEIVNCPANELYENVQFIFQTHGPCTLQQFWNITYFFTEGPHYNEQTYAFFVNYRRSRFQDTITDFETECILQCLEASANSFYGQEFASFLSGRLPDITRQLFLHPAYAAWHQHCLIRSRENNIEHEDYANVLRMLGVL